MSSTGIDPSHLHLQHLANDLSTTRPAGETSYISIIAILFLLVYPTSHTRALTDTSAYSDERLQRRALTATSALQRRALTATSAYSDELLKRRALTATSAYSDERLQRRALTATSAYSDERLQRLALTATSAYRDRGGRTSG